MTTKHNHGPNFGKRIADCPRCIELDNGAESIKWRTRKYNGTAKCTHKLNEMCTCGW